ncbi:hypothetical protein CT0861_09377 [Colletotrichum tofieldiae]|uniref:Uncharacterized protein n=1 Tax=Colletotrichum tofieldiae TaxID=708197 RepID=A0A166TVI5_9PEZI|nr:hypothetical protein CT0861_09377 [Colletotrichum tofieldiae]
MPKNPSSMRHHRCNRHPQLLSPADNLFPPLHRHSHHETASSFRPSVLQSFYQTLPSSAFEYPPPAQHDASFHRGTTSFAHRSSDPLYRESPLQTHLPPYLQGSLRDLQRSELNQDVFTDITPSIESDPSTRSASPDLSTRGPWTSSRAPVSDSLASRSYSPGSSISPLDLRPRGLNTPGYISAPLSPSTSTLSDVTDDFPAALPQTPPRPRQHTQSPSPPSCVFLPSPFHLSRQAGSPNLQARFVAPEDRYVAFGGPHGPRGRCGECFCRIAAGSRGGLLTAEGMRLCGYCRAYHRG